MQQLMIIRSCSLPLNHFQNSVKDFYYPTVIRTCNDHLLVLTLEGCFTTPVYFAWKTTTLLVTHVFHHKATDISQSKTTANNIKIVVITFGLLCITLQAEQIETKLNGAKHTEYCILHKRSTSVHIVFSCYFSVS